MAVRHKYRDNNYNVPEVFLLQNTQYRDSEAIQIKLDELIRVIEGAHNALLEYWRSSTRRTWIVLELDTGG